MKTDIHHTITRLCECKNKKATRYNRMAETALACGLRSGRDRRQLWSALRRFLLIIWFCIKQRHKIKMLLGCLYQAIGQLYGRPPMSIGNLAEILNRRTSRFRYLFGLVSTEFLNVFFRVHGITIAKCYRLRNSILLVPQNSVLLSN